MKRENLKEQQIQITAFCAGLNKPTTVVREHRRQQIFGVHCSGIHSTKDFNSMLGTKCQFGAYKSRILEYTSNQGSSDLTRQIAGLYLLLEFSHLLLFGTLIDEYSLKTVRCLAWRYLVWSYFPHSSKDTCWKQGLRKIEAIFNFQNTWVSVINVSLAW